MTEHIVFAVAKAAYALHEEYKCSVRVQIINSDGQIIGCLIAWPELDEEEAE